MRPLALLLLLLLPTASAAQESATPFADSLRAAGTFADAIAAYHTALREARDSGGDAPATAYSLGSTYALSGQYPDSAFAYLAVALESDNSVAALYDADLYFLVDDPAWNAFAAERLDRLEERIGQTFDRDYARTLLAARMNEWGYRWHVMFGFRTLGPDSPVLTALAHAMQKHHAENEQIVLSLLDSRGWPRLSAVGEEAAYAAGNILTHADLATRQKYLPMIEAACEAGEADWSDYAPILDRTELESGRAQVFGTQMELNEAAGVFEPQPMVDPDKVDERRGAKGMEPIADQLARFNAAMKRDFGGSR